MVTLIQADNLTRYFGRHCAVNDVSFTLSKGEVLGFLGSNGAGKTTTMQMLCGNLAPSSGQIKINGHDLIDKPKSAKRKLGYLPDTPPLYKELTVEEFLRYCAELHGLNKIDAVRAIKHVSERCGLSEVSNRLITHLSKGYQQRIGIAQAILHNPDVIVLDEPTVGLDPIQIREIRSLIRELGRDHGVILSTHILTEVQESCTHVQIIHQGQLILNETIAGLNQLMNTGTLQITTRLTPDIHLLSVLSGVYSIENPKPNQIIIHHDVNNSPAEQIASIIVGAAWGLLEMTPVKKSMEDIFISLTQEHHSLE
jgi:ABC-2 type transport system ATP-binding protein